MSLRRSVCTIVLLLVLGATRAAAEPSHPCVPSEPCHLRMREETTLRKDNGEEFRLPPGHFYDMDTNQELDNEFKRLQNQETRLTAENKAFRESMESWKPGWFTVTAAILVGAAGGIGGYYWYTQR